MRTGPPPHGDGDGCLEAQEYAFFPGESEELFAPFGQECLVSRHHVLAVFNRREGMKGPGFRHSAGFHHHLDG